MRKEKIVEDLKKLEMRDWINIGDIAKKVIQKHNDYLNYTISEIEKVDDKKTVKFLITGLKYEAMSLQYRFMKALSNNIGDLAKAFQNKVDEATFKESTKYLLGSLDKIDSLYFNDNQDSVNTVNAFGNNSNEIEKYKEMIVTLQGTDREIDLWETIKVFSSDDYEREDEYVRFMRLIMDKTYPITFYNSLVKPLIAKAIQKEQDGDYLVMEVSEQDVKEIINACKLDTVNRIDGCKKVLCIIYFIK